MTDDQTPPTAEEHNGSKPYLPGHTPDCPANDMDARPGTCTCGAYREWLDAQPPATPRERPSRW